jgi:hypothetical protein
MWRRTYIGSFTREGSEKSYEREQQRLEDESTGQRAIVVNLSDRKRIGMVYIFRPGSCNYLADMRVLTAGHFAGLGVGIVPKYPTGFV